MNRKHALGLAVMGIALVIILPAITIGQFGGFKKGGGGGGGMPKGGGGGGGFDSGRMFDFMSGGKGYIVIAERTRFKEEMLQYAQERGINDGKLTRDQYVDFVNQQNNKLSGGGQPGGMRPMGAPGGDGGKKFGGGGGGSKTEQAQADPAVIQKWAEDEFKQRDVNGDKKLTGDEIRGPLKDNLSRWDRNNDGAIDFEEFKDYYAARFQGDPSAGGKGGGIASIIIEENELDLKITVLRAGKLPKNMPGWFGELDTDKDGQVALFEWRAGKKNLDEFLLWDLNDDGFITPEECLKQQEVIAKGGTLVPGGGLAMGGRGGQFGGKGGGRGFGGGGFGRGGGDGTMDPSAGGGGFGKKGGGGFGGGGFGGKKGGRGSGGSGDGN